MISPRDIGDEDKFSFSFITCSIHGDILVDDRAINGKRVPKGTITPWCETCEFSSPFNNEMEI